MRVAATTKRGSDREPVRKNPRTDQRLHINTLLNKPKNFVPILKRTKKKNLDKPKRITSRNNIFEKVGRYDVVRMLANADKRMTATQLVQGDGDQAKRHIRRLLTTKEDEKGRVAAAVYVWRKKRSQALKIVQVAMCGRMSGALIKSRASSNLL